jgi:hypothetical protein
MKKLLFFIVLSAISFVLSAQQIWYVTQTGAGNHSGSDWQNALPSIQMAINQCQPCDQIWVAKGVYREILTIHVDGVEMYGGFMGNMSETQIDQRRWRANQTIINGGGRGSCVEIQVDDCRVDGFTIENGDRQSGFAGGITVYGVNGTTLKNLIIRHNIGMQGGGIHLQLTNNTLIQNVEINDNTAGGGGGIWMAMSHELTMVNVLIYRNSAIIGGIPKGGGLFVEISHPTLINVTIANNSVSADEFDEIYFGKGIYSTNSLLTLYNSIIDEGITIGVFHDFPYNQYPRDITAYNSAIKYVFVSHTNIPGCPFLPTPCTHYPTYDFYNSMIGSIDFEAIINPAPPSPPWGNLQLFPQGTFTNCTSYPNPNFISPTASNYRLNVNSPCIDAGLNQYVVPYTYIDLEGNCRIDQCVDNHIVDMGVYEHNSLPAPPNIVNERKNISTNKEKNLSKKTEKFKLIVFPNPTMESNKTTIHLTNGTSFYENAVKINIYAIDGGLIYTQTFPHGNIQTDFSALAAGMYVLKLQTKEGENYKHKLLISK